MARNKNKRRCGADRLDGKRCTHWALRDSDPPRCRKHDPAIFAPGSGRRCTAETKAGRRCRNAALRGRDVCASHARLSVPGEAARRAGRVCTASGYRGRPCGNWAVSGSDPPLCSMHALQLAPRSGGRRCQAVTESGRRCRKWAMRASRSGQALCGTHARRRRTPGAHERCEAITGSGEPCRQWPVRDSERRYGARLCAGHLPDEDPRRARLPLPGGERRCRAMTVGGTRCAQWAVKGGGGLCRAHAYPDAHPNITHGFYRAVPHFSQAMQAEIGRLAEEGKPLAAEVLLVRLKTRGVFAYFSRQELPAEEQERCMRLILRCVRVTSRLLRARKRLADAGWRPHSAGAAGQMLEAMRRGMGARGGGES